MESKKVYKQYRDEIIILLKAGLRVSELCGLAVKYLNFQNRSFNVEHQLLRDTEVGYYIVLIRQRQTKMFASFQ